MRAKIPTILPVMLILIAVLPSAQERAGSPALIRLQAGVDYYARGLFGEALIELRAAEAASYSTAQKAEAFFWIGVTEISAGQYEPALESFEAMEKLNPIGRRMADAPYHRGRALYYLGRYEEGIVQFGKYREGLPVDRNGVMDSQTEILDASALYWIGECLYSLGHLERAEDVFAHIVDKYPNSYKYEASYYRIALIAQKRVESELLMLLGWTHEESLKTMEEYRLREHSYEQALMAYQRRIADLLRDTRLSDLESENTFFRQQLAASEERIRNLERELRTAQTGQTPSQSGTAASRLSTMRASALELMDEINRLEGN